MKKRVLIGLAAGALMAALQPGVAFGDAGGVPNASSVVLATPASGADTCYVNFTEPALSYATQNITELQVRNGTFFATCRFGPDDLLVPGTFPDRVITVSLGGGSFIQVGPSGHGISRVVISPPA